MQIWQIWSPGLGPRDWTQCLSVFDKNQTNRQENTNKKPNSKTLIVVDCPEIYSAVVWPIIFIKSIVDNVQLFNCSMFNCCQCSIVQLLEI